MLSRTTTNQTLVKTNCVWLVQKDCTLIGGNLNHPPYLPLYHTMKLAGKWTVYQNDSFAVSGNLSNMHRINVHSK